MKMRMRMMMMRRRRIRMMMLMRMMLLLLLLLMMMMIIMMMIIIIILIIILIIIIIIIAGGRGQGLPRFFVLLFTLRLGGPRGTEPPVFVVFHPCTCKQHGQTVVPWQIPKPGLQTHHNYYHTPKLVMWGSPVE